MQVKIKKIKKGNKNKNKKCTLTSNDYLYMGNYFKEMEEDYEMMMVYYRMGAKLGNGECYFNMGLFYEEVGDYDTMETCYIKAAKRNNTDALNNLGVHFRDIELYGLAKTCLKKAVKKGNIDSMFNLGKLYWEVDDYDNMKKYYYMAGEKGCINSLKELGVYFHDLEEDHEKGQFYLSWAITASIFGKDKKQHYNNKRNFIEPEPDSIHNMCSSEYCTCDSDDTSDDGETISIDNNYNETYDDLDMYDDSDSELECTCIYCHFHNP